MATNRPAGAVEEGINPETWLEEHGDFLFRYAWSRLRNRYSAEDLVQDTFLAAIDMRGRFQGRSSLRTWLLGILRHKIIDYMRRMAREVPIEDESTLDNISEKFFDARGEWLVKPSEWKDDPSRAIERKEFWDVLMRCLAELPENMASTFVLRELEELDSQEICRALHITSTNLGALLYRARLRLRRCLEMNWFV
jgi:RNA polymerase sigma-70 factor (ECF subfamily)